MWILECDSDIFNRKRIWLRPGSRHVVGRPPKDANPGQYVADEKTMSRKHIMIDVASIEPGSGTNPNGRSKVTVKDLDTKFGTLLNGTKIKGTSVDLDKDVNEIQAARYQHLFKISWHPVVFTMSFTSKELRAEPTQKRLRELEALDIKYTMDYIKEHSTHVLTNKRNTPKGLQALVNGKYIVQRDSFLDAIFAITVQPPGGELNNSELEKDFDSSWPKEEGYLPAPSNEPTQLSAPAYAPDPARQNIFDGYTFVFYNQAQHVQLIAPISDGGGKAALKTVSPNENAIDDTVKDFVIHVKGLAGEKGLGSFEDGSEGKGVVVVRWIDKGSHEEWCENFITKISQLLDHRPIEQSEFLDAILRNNASVLRRPLEPAMSGVTASSFVEPARTQPAPQVESAIAPPRRTGISRRPVTSRFTGFDDSDDSDVEEETPAPKTQVVENPVATIQESQESGMFVSDDEPDYSARGGFSRAGTQNAAASQRVPATQNAAATQNAPSTQNASSRKRPAPIEETSIMDQLAPTNAGLKRRRLAEQADRRLRGLPSLSPSPPPPARTVAKPKPAKEEPAPKTKARSKKAQQLEELEPLRRKNEQEAEQAKKDREALEASLEDMDINEVRYLQSIEDMELRSDMPAERTLQAPQDNPRWKEEWNGRQNFKKFRRRGETRNSNNLKVIVELEEVKKVGYGLNDNGWLDGSDQEDNGRKKGKGKGRGKSKASQSQKDIRGIIPKEPMAVGFDDDFVVMDVEPEPQTEPPRVSSASQRTSTTVHSQTLTAGDTSSRTSKSQPATSTTSTLNKRPATTSLKKPGPVKKARGWVKEAVNLDGEDEDEDEEDSDDSDGGVMKFKFRKGRGKR